MIYIHVPFCKSFCTYCGFYSELCQNKSFERDKSFEEYTRSICREADSRRQEIIATSAVNTLYFGGGTPSVLPLDCIRRIVEALPFDSHGYDEFTVEMNPDDVTPALVEGLASLGVNRISLGIQSFDDTILRWMNRRHDSKGAVEAVKSLKAGGIRNISIDLIFGLPQLSEALWKDTVDKALMLEPTHISAYQLSIEEDSALERMLRDGRFEEASQEHCRAQYDYLCGRLAGAGYHHYEVSNFALPGYEAVHNSAYWSRAPYVGLGPGAHSFDGARRRSWNPHLDGTGGGYEILTEEDAARERIMLGLRTSAGIPAEELKALGEGILELSAEIPGNLRIPESRFFVSDDIISSLLI